LSNESYEKYIRYRTFPPLVPGCGDGVILEVHRMGFAELKARIPTTSSSLPASAVPAGMPTYFNTNTLHTTHGAP